ncbi:hypothetical protein PPYR_11702 [Photinus pyralis]|uniref:Nucleotide exchange factor SIL1 n=1 Tax=Photinus pyralis TaxID=7054 RepID=A0A5N4AC04_PHOPY|nr:nucleotide exchange factor SIL1 [Photinus pyralis]KAB0794863.1 hypothetical protein PPYR_11702 [Photinus pyralis]
MFKIILCITLSSAFCANTFVNCSENLNDEDDLFVPTYEWQVIKKGQKIPKGLHVRVNFETGVREAKILVEDDITDKTSAVVQVPDARNSNSEDEAPLKYSHQELKEALKNIKNDASPEEQAEKKFRSYEELKEDLSKLDVRPKTDGELLKELMLYHKVLTTTQEHQELIVSIIEDLEYLVHQIDNANDFVTLNGFADIIYPNLNSTNLDIKDGTLKLLGSSMQNNAKVQIHAFETGAIGTLLKVLVLNSDETIKNRAIFALSGLMRRFPLAQRQFLDNAGLNVFGELLQESNNMKLLLKIVTLIHDLILEHDGALKDKSYLEKIEQYNAVNLRQKLQDQKWCPFLVTLLRNIVSIDVEDHDAVEKTLNTIISSRVCNMSGNVQLQTLISHLQSYYKNLAKVDDDEYFGHLLDLCQQAINVNLKRNVEL